MASLLQTVKPIYTATKTTKNDLMAGNSIKTARTTMGLDKQNFEQRKIIPIGSCADPEGGSGPPSPPPLPWKITKIYGSLAILVRIPLKSQSYQSSIQCWAIIGPPAKRHLNGVSMAGRCWHSKSGIWILPPLIKLKKRYQSWIPSDKTFWFKHLFWCSWKSFWIPTSYV